MGAHGRARHRSRIVSDNKPAPRTLREWIVALTIAAAFFTMTVWGSLP